MIPFMAPMMMGQATAAVLPSTFDPTFKGPGVTLSSDLLTATGPTSVADSITRGTNSRSIGKLYFEFRIVADNSVLLGVANANAPITGFPGSSADSLGYLASNGSVRKAGVIDTIGASSTGDVVGIAINFTTSKLWFLRNGAALSGDPSAGTGGYTLPAGALYPAIDVNSSNNSIQAKFGAGGFSFAPPSGFLPWG